MVKTKIWLGIALLLVVLTSSFYIMMPENVRIDFSKTRTKFSVWENEKFVLAGYEYTRLFDGSKLMRAKSRTLVYDLKDGTTEVLRTANFKDGIIATDKYVFDNNVTEVEQVPVSHDICVINGSGKIFEYLIQNILYEGVTKDIVSPFSFGHRMKVDFMDGYYRARVYQNKVAADKLIVRYRVTSDDQCFSVRLFDPVAVSAPSEGDLVGFWTLAESDTDNVTIKDKSGNNNDGTSANTPVFIQDQNGVWR